ncbi:MAG TPA: hypothetical protein VJ044_18330 [Candidatus Hodarchaeales archaeon]|nr:hypothetical protein [Candidatus Hodarchaeales archaeon]
MPKMITSVDEFRDLLKTGIELRMKPSDGKVKLKLKTKDYLYTYITESKEADSLWRSASIPKKEVK